MLAAIVCLPFLGALALLALPDRARRAAFVVAAAVTAAALVLTLALAPAVLAGDVPAAGVAWLPVPGANLGFRLDGLALLFALLVSGIGLLVLLYAAYYLGPDEPVPRFLVGFLAFTGSMLGIVLADNLLLLAVFWELTSLASFVLIGFWSGQAEARQGARMALAVTGLGGLALLGGVVLIGQVVGSVSLDAVLAAGDLIRADGRYPAIVTLVLLAAFTKSAQWPFHFWLPRAMAAPTPVSAFLHSATLVKAGVFLLARLHPALAGTELWFLVVTGVGLVTLVGGSWQAIFQHDLKGLLAYSTISHLGLITLLFGLNAPLATVAGVFHILNHATFKASLFMAAGIIDHETGSRDMRQLHGLWRYMPLTGVLAIVSSLAMAGVPLLNGFLSKEMFFAETLFLDTRPVLNIAVPLLATLAGAFGVAYSARFVHDVFWNGAPQGLPREPHPPPRWMLAPVAVLAGLCLAVGVVPEPLIGPLLAASAGAALGGPLPEYTLALWHGFNLPLAMSVVALAAGIALYLSLQRVFRLHDRVHLPPAPEATYRALERALTSSGRWLGNTLARGRLPDYLAWLVAAALAAGAYPLSPGALAPGSVPATQAGIVLPVVWAIGLAAAAGAVLRRGDRVTALVFVGVVGLAVTVSFATLSAPDLALTQLLVEVVSIVLLLLALNFLPATVPEELPGPAQARDGLLAVAAGIGMAAISYAILTRPTASIAGYYLANAVPGAAGTNAVNVIIVDFRGFDTLGEITVLGIAGLIVGALLQGLPRTAAGEPPPRSFLLDPAAAALLPLAATVATFLFLRGHNLPGGGFIAGLLLAAGLLLPYLARGHRAIDPLLPASWAAWVGAGLATALATGLASLLLAFPFLTSTHAEPRLPGLGVVPLASAALFDLGVFLVVVGATLIAVLALARPAAPGPLPAGGPGPAAGGASWRP